MQFWKIVGFGIALFLGFGCNNQHTPIANLVSPGQIGSDGKDINGNQTLIILGEGFDEGVTVSFGESPQVDSPQVDWLSDTEVKAKVPAILGSKGKVKLTLRNPNGNSFSSKELLSAYYSKIAFSAREDFQLLTTVSTPNPSALLKADVNKDGKDDLITTNLNDKSISVILAGQANPIVISVGKQPIAITSGDFNGDGDIDLVVSHQMDKNILFLKGNSTGNFTVASMAIDPSATPQVNGLVSGDFDGDGKLDLALFANTIITAASQKGILILLGNKDGTFTIANPANPLAVGVAALSLLPGDLNGDGKIDLVVNNKGTVFLLINKSQVGNILFQNPAPINLGNLFTATSVTIGDFAGVEKQSIGVVGKTILTSQVLMLSNDGLGEFNIVTNDDADLKLQNVTASAAGDINGDGKLDLLVVNNGQKNISVLLSHGDGTFQSTPTNFDTSFDASFITTLDFNGDGNTDFAIASQNQNILTVWLNQSK